MKNLLEGAFTRHAPVGSEIPWPKRMEPAANGVFASLPSRPAMRVSTLASRSGALTAMVGLTGAITGTLSLCCPSAAACSIAICMLGVRQPNEEQIHICLGELAYRIARTMGKEAVIPGQAIPDQEFLIASPVVADGANDELDLLAESHLFAVDFQGLPLWIRLSLHDSDF